MLEAQICMLLHECHPAIHRAASIACSDCTAVALASSNVFLYGVRICPTYATQHHPKGRLVHAIRSAVQQVHCHHARCLNMCCRQQQQCSLCSAEPTRSSIATLMDPTTPLPCEGPCNASTSHQQKIMFLSYTSMGCLFMVICSSEQCLELAVAMSDAVMPLSRSVNMNLYISLLLHTHICILAAYNTIHAVSADS